MVLSVNVEYGRQSSLDRKRLNGAVLAWLHLETTRMANGNTGVFCSAKADYYTNGVGANQEKAERHSIPITSPTNHQNRMEA